MLHVTGFNFQTKAEAIGWLYYLRSFPRRLSMEWKLSRRIFAKGIIYWLNIINNLSSYYIDTLIYEILLKKLLSLRNIRNFVFKELLV